MAKALKTAGMIVAGVALAATGVGALLMPGLVGATTLFGVSMSTLQTVSAGLAAVGGLLDKPKSKGSASPTDWTSNPDQPTPFAFGRVGVAGKIIHRDEYGPDNMYQSIVAVLSGAGPVRGNFSYTGDEQAVTFGSGGIAVTSQWSGEMWMQYRLGEQPDAALTSPPGLKSGAALPGWTSAHKLSGKSCYMQTLGENSKISAFGGQEPKPVIEFDGIYGYDPRYDDTYPGGSGPCRLNVRSTYRWIDDPIIGGLNWALGMMENGKVTGGVGASIEAIDVASFVEAANISEANAWKVTAWPDTSEDTAQVLRQLLEAGGAVYARTGGLISCMSRGAPRASIATLTARDTAGPFELDTGSSNENRINTITPSFMSASAGWKIVPANPVTFQAFRDEDGGTKSKGLTYRFVPGVTQAAQLAAYDILDPREPFSGTVPIKPHLRRLRKGDCFTISEPGFLLDGVKCLVLGRPEYDTKTGIGRISFRSETDSKHDLALGKTTTMPSYPTLTPTDTTVVSPPLPFDWTVVPRPPSTGGGQVPGFDLTGAVSNATATAILVEWGATSDPTDSGNWQQAYLGPPTATTIPITGVQPGATYYIAVSYMRGQNFSPRTIYGPYVAPGLVAEDVSPSSPTITDINERVQQLFDAVDGATGGGSSAEAAAASAAAAAAARDAAQTAAANSAAARDLAQSARDDAQAAYAAVDAARDAAIAGANAAGGYAATTLTYRDAAAGSAGAAAASAVTASSRATDSNDSAVAAASQASAANTSANQAGSYASAADTARVQAQTARSGAESARDSAASSSTTAAGSAASAGTSATNAANSASAAGGSATAASGSASTASTRAGEASTSAASALASSISATASQGAAAGSASAAVSAASTATAQADLAGTRASAADTSRVAAETARGGAEAAQTSAATSASTASGSASTATSAASVAASARDTALGYRDTAGGYASAAAGSASTASASQSAAGASAAAASASATNADAYRAQAGTYASNAAASSSSAAGYSAAAQSSAGLSARIGLGTMNGFPTFALFDDATGGNLVNQGIPNGWSPWGQALDQRRVAGRFSDWAFYQHNNAAGPQECGITQSFNTASSPGLANVGIGYYVLEADIRFAAGQIGGAGVLFYCPSGDSLQLNFANDAPVGYDAPLGATWGEVKTLSFRKLIRMSNPGTGQGIFHLMTDWGGFDGTRRPKIVIWDRCDVRPATDSEVAAQKADANASQALANIASEASARASETAALATRANTTEALARSIPNLLANSDFSDGLRYWSSGAGCHAYYDAAIGAYGQINGAEGATYLVSDFFRINPGQPYSFSFEGDGGSSPTTATMYMQNWSDSGGAPGTTLVDGLSQTSFEGATWFQRKQAAVHTSHGSAAWGRFVVQRGAAAYVNFSRIMVHSQAGPVAWSDEATVRQVSARTAITESSVADAQSKLAVARLVLLASASGSTPALIGLLSGAYGSNISFSADQIWFGENTVFDNATDTLTTLVGGLKRIVAWGAPFGGVSDLLEWWGPSGVAISAATTGNGYNGRMTTAPYVFDNVIGTGPFTASAPNVRVKTQVGGSGAITTASVPITIAGNTGAVDYTWTAVFGDVGNMSVSSSASGSPTFSASPAGVGRVQVIWAWSAHDAGTGITRTGQTYVTIQRDA